ncbi:uncharacterized protein O3C94_003215 [Discoglossus pictus]
MGSAFSKQNVQITTTTATFSTFPRTSAPTIYDAAQDDCRCEVQIVLAFFSGGLLTLLIIILSVCFTKMKSKGKSNLKDSKGCSETVLSPDDNPVVPAGEGITYATLSFKKELR